MALNVIAGASVETSGTFFGNTGNLTSVAHPSNGVYEVTIAGAALSYATHAALATPILLSPASGTTQRVVSVQIANPTTVRVFFTNVGGLPLDSHFHLVVWEL